MDDPLFLLMQGVWLLAAGMYPLGFMFGVCSACCCPECNDCTHRFKGGDVEAPGDQFGCKAPVNITFDTPAGSVTFENYRIDFEDRRTIWDLECGGAFIEINSIGLVFPAPQDECGCFGCGYNVVLTLRAGGSQNEFSLDLFLGSCDQTSDTKTGSLEFEIEGCDIPDRTVTVTIDVDPCECGACCYEDNSCTDNIPEFYCEDPVGFFGVAQGTWQGVGTSCDPNPCEE
jgi:hypothetical protein